MIRIGRFHFKPALASSICFLLIFPLLLSLGYWQIDRGKQKQWMLEKHEARQSNQRIKLAGNEFNTEYLRYRPVIVRGGYDSERQFLLDNRVVKGKVGYFVLTPLRIENSNHSVLVNRGWTPIGKDRSEIPDLTIAETEVTINGTVDHFPGLGIRLKDAEVPTPGWPATVLAVDPRKLSEVLGYPLLPFQVLLDEDEKSGEGLLHRQWKITTSILPEKHRAYAFQWFALATVLVILYVWYSMSADE